MILPVVTFDNVGRAISNSIEPVAKGLMVQFVIDNGGKTPDVIPTIYRIFVEIGPHAFRAPVESDATSQRAQSLAYH